ncbi:conserved hypothetical protein [Candidatus Brocadia pituitae]|nr:conserved hypothetical protein [Candidatus Brocadia pituitae]
MTVDEARKLLQKASLSVVKEERLPNNTSTKLRVSNGAIVNVFDKGTFNVQGKNSSFVESVLGQTPTASSDRSIVISGNRKVFCRKWP